MSRQGQILIIVAVLLMVGLTLLAVAVDAGRLMIERARLERGAQAAADAGLGWVSEQMVTLAVPRMTAAAGLATCAPLGACTATPEPAAIARWLTDEDRATLVSPPVATAAASEAIAYARRNDLGIEPTPASLQVIYPYDYQPSDTQLRLLVRIREKTTILLAGLLGGEFVDLVGEGQAELLQR